MADEDVPATGVGGGGGADEVDATGWGGGSGSLNITGKSNLGRSM